MKKQTKKTSSKQTNKKNVKYKNDGIIFESTIISPKGNKNTFRIMRDKNAPFLQQEIKE